MNRASRVSRGTPGEWERDALPPRVVTGGSRRRRSLASGVLALNSRSRVTGAMSIVVAFNCSPRLPSAGEEDTVFLSNDTWRFGYSFDEL